MKLFFLCVVLLTIASLSLGQDISFGTSSKSKNNNNNDKDVDTRAPSTFDNCDCQCNSDKWTDGRYIRGNCESVDSHGALFCYVSGRAFTACRDVKRSEFLTNNQGRFKFYSYEACITPPRNRCNNFHGGNQNFGDGDLDVIDNNNNHHNNRPSFGSRPNRPSFGSGSFGSGNGNRPNRPSFGSGNRPNRPSFGSGSFGSGSFGSGSFGSGSGNRPNRPSFGSGSNNRPTFGSGSSNWPFRVSQGTSTRDGASSSSSGSSSAVNFGSA